LRLTAVRNFVPRKSHSGAHTPVLFSFEIQGSGISDTVFFTHVLATNLPVAGAETQRTTDAPLRSCRLQCRRKGSVGFHTAASAYSANSETRKCIESWHFAADATILIGRERIMPLLGTRTKTATHAQGQPGGCPFAGNETRSCRRGSRVGMLRDGIE
jgi:hypothetical protein